MKNIILMLQVYPLLYTAVEKDDSRNSKQISLYKLITSTEFHWTIKFHTLMLTHTVQKNVV